MICRGKWTFQNISNISTSTQQIFAYNYILKKFKEIDEEKTRYAKRGPLFSRKKESSAPSTEAELTPQVCQSWIPPDNTAHSLTHSFWILILSPFPSLSLSLTCARICIVGAVDPKAAAAAAAAAIVCAMTANEAGCQTIYLHH